MKTTKIIILVLLVGLSGLIHCQAQGFINLNFEAATIVYDPSGPYGPDGVNATNALPGWSSYIGNSLQSSILFNTISLGGTAVSILGTNGTPSPLSGRFSVELYGGLFVSAATISQTGLVPTDAVSLIFMGRPTIGTMQVSLGGQNLTYFTIASGQNYNIYAADVSAFAGRTLPLSFSALTGNNNYWELDDIQFSTSAVPEPRTSGLLAAGGLAGLLVKRRQMVRK